MALINDLFIPVQPISFQRAEDIIGSPFDGARDVQAFDAYQPLSLMMFGVEIAANGGYQRTEVEGAGGRGRETPSV